MTELIYIKKKKKKKKQNPAQELETGCIHVKQNLFP